jgi:hypothetical protein
MVCCLFAYFPDFWGFLWFFCLRYSNLVVLFKMDWKRVGSIVRMKLGHCFEVSALCYWMIVYMVSQISLLGSWGPGDPVHCIVCLHVCIWLCKPRQEEWTRMKHYSGWYLHFENVCNHDNKRSEWEWNITWDDLPISKMCVTMITWGIMTNIHHEL